jgi:hypothetical protein
MVGCRIELLNSTDNTYKYYYYYYDDVCLFVSLFICLFLFLFGGSNFKKLIPSCVDHFLLTLESLVTSNDDISHVDD